MGSLGSMAMALPRQDCTAWRRVGGQTPRSVAPAQEPQLVGPQLRPREPATGHRVVGDDPPGGVLVGRLEDPDPGVDRPERRPGQAAWAAKAARSSSVMVAAKSSRGGCRK